MMVSSPQTTAAPPRLLALSRCWQGWIVLLLVAAALPAASHHFVVDEVQLYRYELRHVVHWESAGDELRFESRQRWHLSLTPREVTAEGVLLAVRVLTLHALHEGPGIRHEVYGDGDPAQLRGADDPLLGDLLALIGPTLELDLDPASGLVRSIDGQQALIEALVARHPGPPGEASPMVAAAAAHFDPQRLAAFWSALLALPGSEAPAVPLEGELGERLLRRWEGSRWTIDADSTAPLTSSIQAGATRIPVKIQDLEGGGELRQDAEGSLLGVTGDLRYRLSATALTQPLRQQHELSWELGRVDLIKDEAP